MPKLVLCQGNYVALYHGRNRLGIWILTDDEPDVTKAELVEQVRNYNPQPGEVNV